LLDSTLAVALGEFGRSGRVNAAAGRDHWSLRCDAVLAGGGAREKLVYGASYTLGGYREPRECPIMSDSVCPVIRKYGGRFYDTGINAYVTLADLGRRLKDGQEFTVTDELGGKDLTQQVLKSIQFQQEMAHTMRTLIREGKFPHDLLDHHWFRGNIQYVGPHEIRLSVGTEYFPVDAIAIPDEMPATLAKKDYRPQRAVDLFERWKEKQRKKNQARITAGKKASDVDALTMENTGLPQQIDGITCHLLPCWLEEGLNCSQLIDAVLKPLGYAKVKGEKDGYQKRLSGGESLSCRFGMEAGWRVRYLRARMGYHCGEQEIDFSLMYWGAFHWIEWMKADNMDAMMITTERVFRLAVENIGFLLTELETNCLDDWRGAASQPET
jgi:hypothetical protein